MPNTVKQFKIGLSSTDKQNMAQDIYERVESLLFNEYNTSSSYNKGDYVVHNGTLYRSKEDNVTGTWDSSKWEQATLQDLVDDVNGAVDSVADKANVNGNYPTMTVGQADSITSDREIEDAEDACPPITFGTAGGSAEIQSGYNNFEELRGNSIVWNQLVKNGNFADSTRWSSEAANIIINDGVGTATFNSNSGKVTNYINDVTQGHKYLILASLKANDSGSTPTLVQYLDASGGFFPVRSNVISWNIVSTIFTVNSLYANPQIQVRNLSAENVTDTTIQIKNVMLIDLTQMFGAGNEPETVEEFRKLFPKPYYEYNAGTLLSSQSTSLISRGRNQWDEEWVNSWGNVGNVIASKNFIRVFPNTEYFFKCPTEYYPYVAFYDANQQLLDGYSEGGGSNIINSNSVFTTPENACYMKFRMQGQYGTTYKNDICIYINWDTPNLPYVPYEAQTVTLPNIELRSAGSVYDVLYATGGGKRRIGVVDLSTITFTHDGTRWYASASALGIKLPSSNDNKANLTSSKYSVYAINTMATDSSKIGIGIATNGNIYIYDIATNIPTGYLNYELATETDIPTSENEGWTELVKVDNFGTLQFTTSPEQVPQVPQAYFIRYTVNLVEFLDTAYVRTNGDANNIALNSELTTKIETYLKSLSGYDSTKNQTLENVSGVFTWVDK